jgi:hypothetical protein
MEHGQGLSFRMLLGSKWHEKRIAQLGKKGWGENLGRRAECYLISARCHVRRDLARRAKEKSAVLNRVSLPLSNSKFPIPNPKASSHYYLLRCLLFIVSDIIFPHTCSNGRSSHSLQAGT